MDITRQPPSATAPVPPSRPPGDAAPASQLPEVSATRYGDRRLIELLLGPGWLCRREPDSPVVAAPAPTAALVLQRGCSWYHGSTDDGPLHVWTPAVHITSPGATFMVAV